MKPERVEDSASDSSPDFSEQESAESSRKSSLSESSSCQLNEVDLIDGKARIVSHFANRIFLDYVYTRHICSNFEHYICQIFSSNIFTHIFCSNFEQIFL